MYRLWGKRVLDVILALSMLIILFPIMILVCILIKIVIGSPVIFKQERPGVNEKRFMMYKFRTMSNETDSAGKLLADEKRLGKLGKTLRKTSIDELPELVNILKGEMSFVGPRPLLVKYLPYYTEEERKRHSVRPGLTGLAQINGRNGLDWNQRLCLDVKYVNHLTFIEDLKIFVKTFAKLGGKSEVRTVNQLSFQDLDIERSEKND